MHSKSMASDIAFLPLLRNGKNLLLVELIIQKMKPFVY